MKSPPFLAKVLRKKSKQNQQAKPELFGFKNLSDFSLVFADPVRLGMQIAFGRVRRKTEPTGPGETETVIISKIDTYGTPQNRTYRVWDLDGYFLSSSAFGSWGVMFTMSCSTLMALQATRVFRIWCANATCFVASSESSAWKMRCFWYP